VDYLRGEMRLFILIRNDIHPEVSDIDYNAKNTGIGDILANKVGRVIEMLYRETNTFIVFFLSYTHFVITFVTCVLRRVES
jgi:hypothetical protein